jgi:hypothetical protein
MHDESQGEHLRRVRQKIGRIVITYWEASVSDPYPFFHAQDLRLHVQAKIGIAIAPASPDRILRDLRQKRLINYKVLDRRNSLYQALPLPPEGIECDL